MAVLVTENVFRGKIQDVFDGIRKYGDYPKYLPGVTATHVLPKKQKGSVCQVKYDLKLIKSFFYTLNMFEESPKKIWWNLAESNIMKKSRGEWLLEEQGNETKAKYSLDIEFRGLVPQRIVDQITKANLKGMMEGFQTLIDDSRA